VTAWPRYLLVAAIALAAAFAGVYVGRQVVSPGKPVENELHRMLHERLHLDARQERQVEAIERRLSARKGALEAQLRAENARLAEALREEHGFGPGVSAAVDRSHHIMGQLQKETLEHIFAMRSILTPAQAREFDASVTKALTAPAR
jgi:hypothetical protein